jgi:hypothetical protein
MFRLRYTIDICICTNVYDQSKSKLQRRTNNDVPERTQSNVMYSSIVNRHPFAILNSFVSIHTSYSIDGYFVSLIIIVYSHVSTKYRIITILSKISLLHNRKWQTLFHIHDTLRYSTSKSNYFSDLSVDSHYFFRSDRFN